MVDVKTLKGGSGVLEVSAPLRQSIAKLLPYLLCLLAP